MKDLARTVLVSDRRGLLTFKVLTLVLSILVMDLLSCRRSHPGNQ